MTLRIKSGAFEFNYNQQSSHLLEIILKIKRTINKTKWKEEVKRSKKEKEANR